MNEREGDLDIIESFVRQNVGGQDALNAIARLRAPAPSAWQPIEDYILPCDVHLKPATTITKGCKLSTLMAAFKVRETNPFRGYSLSPTSLPALPSSDRGGVGGAVAAAHRGGPHDC